MDQINEQNNTNKEETSLIDLLSVLLNYKKLIIIMTGSAAFLAVVLAVISILLPPKISFMPNEFTPEATMLINDNSSSGGGLASALSSSGLGSLASLAGVSVPTTSTNSSLAGYLVTSSIIMDQLIERFDLIKRFEIKEYPMTTARETLSKLLKSDFDSETGVFKIAYTDIDPVFAQQIINTTVDLLEQQFSKMGIDKNKLQKDNLEENIKQTYNEVLNLQKEIQKLEMSVSNIYSPTNAQPIMLETTLKKLELQVQQQLYAQLKAQYESIKITMASEQPVFQILRYAEVPEKKSGPSRIKFIIIITFAAGFLSVFIAFLLNAIKNVKNDPEAMKKLKSEKKSKKNKVSQE